VGLFDIFGTGAQRTAANDQIAGINAGYDQLSGLYGQGRGALQQNYTAGLQPFMQNYGTASGGQNQLASLLGFGPQGSGGIQQTLQNLPGYQFALQQGDENILRNQAATGQLNSGATNLDLQKFGQGLASQNYNNYVSQLQPFLGAANSAAGGIGGLYSGLGNNLNQSFTGQGNSAAGAQMGIGNANAGADLAGLNASGNIWGALSGIAGLGVGGGPMAAGAGGGRGGTLGGNLLAKFFGA
jgi:hypothetical protein